MRQTENLRTVVLSNLLSVLLTVSWLGTVALAQFSQKSKLEEKSRNIKTFEIPDANIYGEN